MLRTYSLDNTAPPPEWEETPTGVVAPITVEELIDQSNHLPRKLIPVIGEITAHIGRIINEEIREKGMNNPDTISHQSQRARFEPNYDQRGISQRIDQLVLGWMRETGANLSPAETRWVRARIQDRYLGYDAIEPLRRDPRVTEILIRRHAPLPTPTSDGGVLFDGGTRIEMRGELIPAPGVVFTDDREVEALANDTLLVNSAISVNSPNRSGMLADNRTRIEVRHRLVTNGEDTFIALRRHPLSAWTLYDLVQAGSISEALACDIATWARCRLNVATAGPTGSGKTSLSNAITGFIPEGLHLMVIEDTREINPPPHVFASNALTRRHAGEQDPFGYTEAIKSALRSRPDILAVGESRAGELLDVLTAMSTGHPGSMTTLHADSGPDTIVRMKRMLGQSGQIHRDDMSQLIATSLDIIIFAQRIPSGPDRGQRRVTGVYEVLKPDPDVTTLASDVAIRTLWEYRDGEHHKVAEVSSETLARRGVDLKDIPRVSPEEILAVHHLSKTSANR